MSPPAKAGGSEGRLKPADGGQAPEIPEPGGGYLAAQKPNK
jgi:hypothetical protein